MMDEEEISETVVSMNTASGGANPLAALLERLRTVNELVQADDGKGDGPRVIYQLNEQSRHTAITERITVGRAHQCTIKVDDAKLSREHFEIVRNEDACMVKDLGSKNGIKVNNEPVEEKILTPGDVISASIYRFVYVED